MIFGIRVQLPDGYPVDVWGYAYWMYVDGQKFWYCVGRSFWDDTVVGVYEIKHLTAEQIYRMCAARPPQ